MAPVSLLRQGTYSLEWVKDFYDQAGIWWGDDPQEPGVHAARLETIERLAGQGPWRILELGCGSGHSAAGMADAGHTVVGVELSSTRASFARGLAEAPRASRLTALEGDFYTIELAGPFEVICCWEVFGLGADADQRRLLQRMAHEWLAPGGRVFMDVYSPVGPTRDAGSEVRLPPLKGVPGSVEMIERCHFDPVQSRWTDEWEPVAAPEKALAQTVRCYAPADFQLLLEGTGLALERVEIDGEAVDFSSTRIRSYPWKKTYSYLAVLRLA